MDTIHFHFDSHGGFGEVKGLARLDEHGLELQFSTAVLGVIRSGLRSLRIPLDVLSGTRYRAGFLWLQPAIELRLRDLAGVAGLPGSEEGRIRLRVRLGERRDARAFACELEAMRANLRIRMLDRTLDRMAGDLPALEPAPSVGGGPTGSPVHDSQSEG